MQFLTTIKSCYITFNTLVTHSVCRISGKFYCTTYRVDKIRWLYGNLTFWGYQKLSHINSIQDKRKHLKCKHFFELQQILTMTFTILYVLSFNLFLNLGTALFGGKFSHVFPSATFNSETVSGFGWTFKKVSCMVLQTRYLQGFKFGELGGHCFFCRFRLQTLLTDTCCVRRAHASRWIYCSVRQQWLQSSTSMKKRWERRKQSARASCTKVRTPPARRWQTRKHTDRTDNNTLHR